MEYRIEIIEDEDEGGFVAYYPDLPGCITCGETVEATLENAVDAKKVWFEVLMEQEEVATDEDVINLSKCFLLKNKDAYEMLANHEIQCAFSRVADELGIKDEYDVQKLVDKIQASETISQKTLSDMDQAIINLKDGSVSPAIDLSDSNNE